MKNLNNEINVDEEMDEILDGHETEDEESFEDLEEKILPDIESIEE